MPFSFSPQGADMADHNVKTLRMHVVATRTLTGNLSKPKVVFHDSYSFDLSSPSPWRAQHFDNYEDRDFRIKFLANLHPDRMSFYPPNILEYIRIDFAAWAWLEQAGIPDPITNQVWIGTGTPHAGLIIQLGPIAGDQLFLSFNLKFENG
jgi:hypothetical protein